MYTSECTRAIQTGWAIRQALPYGIETFTMDELNELSQGFYEGQSRTGTGFVEMIDRRPDEKMFGGQSMYEVGNNMRYALTVIGEDHPGQDVMIVGHAVAMRCFLADLEGYDETVIQRVFKQKIPQCSETEIMYDQGVFNVRVIGRELIRPR